MKFSLYSFNKFGAKVYITQFDPNNEQHNLYSTFNEKISHADNDQITLTFSLVRKIPNERGELIVNPYLKYLVFGSKICLETERNLYELIITQIAPKSSKGNTTYDFTCQDEVSYKWSRIKLGYSYSTTERGGVRNLFSIVSEILEDCQLNDKWLVKEINSHLYPNDNLKNEKITLEVENSNPYNAIIEGLNTLNASMLVNYRNHEIRFYQKDRVIFSGYRYRPETNLRSLSATFNIDELATILHVTGGTDENDMNITLVPPMPDAVNNYLVEHNYELPQGGYLILPELVEYTMDTNTTDVNSLEYQALQKEKQDVLTFCTIADRVHSLGQFLYNFDFFLQNGLMTADQYNEIKNIIDIQMRDINIQLKPLTVIYYNNLRDFEKILISIKSYLEQMCAAYDQAMNECRKQDYIDEEQVNKFHNSAKIAEIQARELFNSSFYRQYENLYGSNNFTKDGRLIPQLDDIKSQVENYIAIRDESEYYYKFYQNKHFTEYGFYYDVNNSVNNSVDKTYDKVNLEGDIVYYHNRFYMALQMVGEAKDFKEMTVGFTAKYYYDKDYLSCDSSYEYNVNQERYVPSYYAILCEPFYRKQDEFCSAMVAFAITKDDALTVKMVGGDLNLIASWGDNSYDENNSSRTMSHTYDGPGIYFCKLYNTTVLPRFETANVITEFYTYKDVQIIPENCVMNGLKLNKITLHEGIVSIGKNAFNGCVELTSIVIPNSVIELNESGIFARCTKLTQVQLSENLINIPNNCFLSCSSLNQIRLPQKLKGIGYNAFASCGLSKIILNDELKYIGGEAFANTNIIDITIPSSVTFLGADIFNGCTQLNALTTPFIGTDPTGDSDTCCLGHMFGACAAGGTNKGTSDFYGYQYSNQFVPDSLKFLTITGSCHIGENAVRDVRGLQQVSLRYGPQTMGDYAFAECDNLSSFYASGGGLKNIGLGGFSDTRLNEIILTDGLESILPLAFNNNESLETICIPATVKIIGGYAFQGCTSLETIFIPEAVNEIGRCVFNGCTSLQEIKCEVRSKPKDWHEDWLLGTTAVVTWEQQNSNSIQNMRMYSAPRKTVVLDEANDIQTTILQAPYGLYGAVIGLEQQIKLLWGKLYDEYSSFIYEATYENTDELNSLSLYNQAITYFEQYHHPKSSYSVEIIDIDELEQIGTPNLKVNSRIRVYNEDLGLDEGETYTGDDKTKLNNISYTTNELLITSLNYELRKSAAVSITVERIIQHQTILQKLIKSIR